MKAITAGLSASRRGEARAGTKTAQILFEGRYDGYFLPDEHYIPLKKDFSNVEEAIRKFRDPSIRRRIADSAYAMVRETMTYDHLLDRFHTMLAQVA